MQSDWILGLVGGLLIGCAGAVLLLGNGRIMGASGILGGLIDGRGRGQAEGWWFVAGLFGVPALAALLWGAPDTRLTGAMPLVVVAGLLVGLGTRIANGCTSGHGVCGVSRLSPRGIVATLVYIAAGAVSVLLFRHVLGMI